MSKERKYQVALSFAGEDRDYVDKVAKLLRGKGVSVFYDAYETVNLLGKDLYEHLDDVYQNQAQYTAMFISVHYKEKMWTNHERKSAQARAFLGESSEYILPFRFDNTEIPGLRSTVGYVGLETTSPEQVADIIYRKIYNNIPEEAVDYVKSLDSMSTTIKIEAIRQLGRIGTPSLTPILAETLKDENDEVRWTAVDALTSIATPEATSFLCAHLDCELNMRVRLGIYNGLSIIGDSVAIQYLCNSLKNTSRHDVMNLTSITLTRIGDVAVKELSNILKEKVNDEVYYSVISTLYAIDSQASRSSLGDAVRNGDELVCKIIIAKLIGSDAPWAKHIIINDFGTRFFKNNQQ